MSAGLALRIPLHYDFASTLCYVAHRVMQRMADDLAELELELVWSPLDLTLLTGWRRGDEIEGVRRANALRVAGDLGVEVRVPNRWIDSRRLNAIAWALEGPAEAAWRERVWSAIYDEGRDPRNPGEVARLGQDLDLDVEKLAQPRELEALDLRTRLAIEAGVSAVPTFMLGEWPIGGIQEPRTMRSLLGRYARRSRAATSV